MVLTLEGQFDRYFRQPSRAGGGGPGEGERIYPLKVYPLSSLFSGPKGSHTLYTPLGTRPRRIVLIVVCKRSSNSSDSNTNPKEQCFVPVRFVDVSCLPQKLFTGSVRETDRQPYKQTFRPATCHEAIFGPYFDWPQLSQNGVQLVIAATNSHKYFAKQICTTNT